MLAARFGDELAAPVVERIVESGQGNPLALVEIARDLTPEQRRAEAPLDGSLPPSAEWAYLRRIEALPADTRRALLLAALAARRARDRRTGVRGDGPRPDGARPRGAGRARRQDATRVTFCHELARTAVSYSALSAERRAAHGALAGAVEGERAYGTRPTPPRARRRGRRGTRGRGHARPRPSALRGRGPCLEQAARLTSDPDRRAERLLGAAQSAHLAVTCTRRSTISGRRWSALPRRALRIELEHARGRIAARSGDAARARDWLTATARALRARRPGKAAEILADAVLPVAEGRLTGRRGASRPPLDAPRPGGAGDRGQARRDAAARHRTAVRRRLRRGRRADRRTRRRDRRGRQRQPHPYLGAALALAGRHARAREVLGR